MKQVIQSDFPMPVLPSDAPKWAWDMLNSLAYALRLLAVREDKQVHEGLEAEKPTADGSKRFYWATDTSKLYYDTGSWTEINPDQPAHPGTSTDEAIARYNGATGDLQNSPSTLDDSGSINIPSGQQFKINGSQHTHISSEVGLGNVTNDAQLKRSANDWGFSDVVPVAGDRLLYEDASDSYNKKICLMSELPDTKPLVILQHRSTSAGGGQTAGSWATRTLNTESLDTDSICTLSSNQFTLPAGTYDIFAAGCYYATNFCQIRLTDSNGTVINNPNSQPIYGTSTYSGGYAIPSSSIHDRFVLASETTLRIESRISLSNTVNGWGVEAGFGNDNVYMIVLLRKIA